jgi:YVTN family beta-propeller protein
MTRGNRTTLVLALIGVLPLAACGAPDVKIASTPIPTIAGSTGSFDDIAIDQAGHRLFAADRSDQGVDVFDVTTAHPKYVQTIPMPADPNGLVIAPDAHRLFVGTASGAVVIADIAITSPHLDDVIVTVPTGGTVADLMDFSADRQRLYVSNGADGTVTSIDTVTGQVKAHFNVGYPVAQPRYDPADGMVYVTSPDADALFRINPDDGTLSQTALGGCQPNGLAINPTSNSALIACQSSVMRRDLRRGSSETVSDVSGGDVVSYDARVDRFFVASPRASQSGIVSIFGGDPIAYITTVATEARGKSAAYDEANGIVYTPDERPSKAGIASFKLPPTPPAWLMPLIIVGSFALLFAVVAPLIYLVGRSADPVRRRERIPRTAPEVAP